jgi:glucose-1-phosphate cytidylyltransferase
MSARGQEMQVVILCGGQGTRAYPFTEYFPKPMMPINGKPILVHLMHIYAEQGFQRFVLAAGHRQEILLDYFEGRFPQWDVKIVDTGEASDTGERIRRCEPYLGQTFFANYGDAVGDISLPDLLAFHRAHGGLATITSVPLRSQYGTIVAAPDGRVEEFREKPVIRDHWINAGFFVFEKRVFERWEGANLERDVFPKLVADGLVYTYRHDGFWKSVDTSKDQQQLQEMYVRGEARWQVPPHHAPSPFLGRTVPGEQGG